MGSMKFDIEKFNGKYDFVIWRIKMRTILIQQGLDEALKGEEAMEGDSKEKIQKLAKAQSEIISCLGDKPLHEVSKEASATVMWTKLESLYMTKSLVNRLFMKQKLYSFKTADEKNISEKIYEFIKIMDDLENIEVKLEEEDKSLIPSNSLPRSYKNFRDALLYGREQTISSYTSVHIDQREWCASVIEN